MVRRLIKTYVRTRFCCCEGLDCRFTSDEICPNGKMPNGNPNPIGKFLWAEAFVDEETGEEVEPSLEDVLVDELIEEAKSDETVSGD